MRPHSAHKRSVQVVSPISAQDVNFSLSSQDFSDSSDPRPQDEPVAMPSAAQLSALIETLTTKFSATSRQNFQSPPAEPASGSGVSRSGPIPKSPIDTTLSDRLPGHPRAGKELLDDAAITDILLDNPNFHQTRFDEKNDINPFTAFANSGNATRKRAASSKRSHGKNVSESESQPISDVASYVNPDEDLVLSMLAQSYAVSSDVLPPTEDTLLPSFPTFSNETHSDQSLSEEAVSKDLQNQTQSCAHSTVELERILSTINKRRAFLSAESANDTLRPLQIDLATFSPNDILEPRLSDERFKTFFDNIRDVSLQSLFIGSVRDSIPIDPHALAHPDEICAITSLAPEIVASCNLPPNTYRPFLALNTAIVRLKNPPCPRCRTPTEKTVLDQDGVCEMCYTTIFLQSPTSNSPRDSFLSREDVAREEDRLARQAISVVRASSTMSENAVTTSDNDVKMKRPPPPGFTSNGGDDTIGNDGSSPPGQNEYPSVGDGWRVAASDRSLRTINPIRNLVQNIRVMPNPSKQAIKLSVGDPTVYGNLAVSASIVDSLCRELKSGRSNGYSLSMGDAKARAAIAKRYSTPSSRLSPDDVFIASGASGALELAIGAMVNEGDNILLPSPGFPLFRTLAEGFGIECRFYELDPDQDWQVKLEDLTRVADKRTRAIVVNNPSNPCGSVFSREHMGDIMAVAAALRLPVIADEVYADMVFAGEFMSFGTVSTEVPTLVVGGISKQFVVPGWRVGWVLVHDRANVFEKAGVRRGLRQLTTRMICANTPVQSVIPIMLQDHDGFQSTMEELQANADFTADALKSIEGLKCVEAKGAMYVMVGVDVVRMGLKDDMEFVERLYEEEAVFVLPGQCFKAPNFVRVVFAAPKEVLADAFSRMAGFCKRRIDANL